MAHHDDDKSKFNVKQICVRNDGLYAEQEEPMSPSGALLRHFNMDCYILVIIGLEKPVDVPSMKTTLQSTLIKHKRFSSVVVSALCSLSIVFGYIAVRNFSVF
jgi:hypothetical protein